MTALYAMNREALAEALRPCDHYMPGLARQAAKWLIDSGAVQIIDPTDDTQVERLARVIDDALGRPREAARAVLRALAEEDQP